ncbi:hypothetical protein METBIDRAFT_31525 [Metschnikowia bicuspidata var. bicuspidata NRRL YB-4993]|uniref:DNA polymerase n=1 Tax=Metschnikowia bicuspidata var. bicuspidata NRRL YB-4993 TaxID=869754 RepID=A0A1A0HAF4_9ASCO|nr:hypothetical protein METBIDRAFT_31525 [Metschnikowia bicuspidata var. bicuspidata NRRL YB-4993]OBA20857.1 hypothetical protein METBIDRAFT_31525 [Metschnikowia bicuspidata var. bicuspidata NRRL YB-4993]
MLSRATKSDKFKRLLEARRTGTIVAHSSDEEDASIYDEVDEDEFRQRKREQLMNDDFIVDDNGEGYVDNGGDEWDESTRPNYYSDEEEPGTKKRKREKPQKKIAKVSTTTDINSFFTADSVPKPKIKTEAKASIDDILDDFDSPKSTKKQKVFGSTTSKPKKSTASAFGFFTSSTAKPKKVKPPSVSKNFKTEPSAHSDGLDSASQVNANVSSSLQSDVVDELEPTEPLDLETGSVTQSLTTSPKAETPDVDNNDESDDDDEIVVRRRPKTAVAAPKSGPVNVSAVKTSEILVSTRLASSSGMPTYASISQTEKLSSENVVDDGSFKMFWLDYAEADSTLLLFGKVLSKDGSCVSAVVQVNGLYKELFVLPRESRVVDSEETNQPVEMKDVHEELAPILIQQYGLDKLRARPEKLKYAFELPGVPKEADYLKILLPFKTNRNRNLVMPAEIEGETFQRIFGTNANIFESFVLQRNIMGPCWLEIKNGDFQAIKNASHCQVEVSVASADCVTPLVNTPLAPPSLTTVTISVQTIMNVKQNKQEVACISLATYKNVPQDSPVDEGKEPEELLTLVRPIGASVFPPGLRQTAEKHSLNVKTLPNEASMLGCMAALIKNIDPDVIVGHRLENISLDVLVHRMHDLRVATWSAMGRRNRKLWPDKFGKGTGFNNNLIIREIFQGRLLCDIANELGQSLTSKCQSWDLPEMYEVVCHEKHVSPEINFHNPRYAEDASFLLMPLKENITQVLITAKISFAVQILSLSKQLTNLAGNAWSHTLSGTRAGRNEFILLHEFKKNNYVVPDKEDKYHKNTNHQQEAKLEAAEDDATTVTSNKKPKYQGGLVFEPEKGLHKNYILVMDFNSLYPSIIQEFNICFTTVLRDAYNISHDEDKDMPDIPERDSEAGVLPRLLNTLVSRRREVKKLLKDSRISSSERAQYDIKQQALKLTANSMYGCLGYVNSRFYAKPLAMLVTNKGREILMDTRQLAELIGLRVVYGDTDSVMIDTGASSFQEALKIGDEFKVQVNERYKLLEIDTDNVFKRLLLHAKKKYAAMNVSIDKKTGKEVLSLEVKGLDMRRREYCQASKDISTFVLKKLLSDMDPEEALTEVYEYLESMNKKIRDNELSIDKFSINTRLSKDPTSYPNGKSMPSVQVALRLRKQGKVVKAGSVVTFIITAPVNAEDDGNPALRARPIQEVLSNKESFKPDCDYYLEKQIYAPVERLLNKIDGVDLMRVATSLGIDSKKYVMRLRNSEGLDLDVSPLESNVTDVERFRQVSFLVLKCKCGHQFRFGGIMFSSDYRVTFNGIVCSKCDALFSLLKISIQLEIEIKRHLALYYAGWLVCDDSACGIKTRQISVYGKRCIGSSGTAHGCKGVMRYNYSDKALYNQLLYFDAIFDVDKAKKKQLKPISEERDLAEMTSGEVNALAEQNRGSFDHYRSVVDQYLSVCGRRYVSYKSLFDFMT